jgi:Uma2 family endonuclease
VRCGPRLPGEALDVSDPIIVVEVASASSRGIDTGVKLAGYFKLPSVRHYLVVVTEARVVIHHRRDDAGALGARFLREGQLSLDPPGLAIEIGDLFASL